MRIRLKDERSGKEDDFSGAGGVKGFVNSSTPARRCCPTTFHAIGSRPADSYGGIPGTEIGVEGLDAVERAYNENVLCFTNNIPQRDGGTHLTGLRAAMTRDRQVHRADNELAKKAKGRGLRPRRHARGPVLRAVGQGARAQVQQPDQGQAGPARKCARRSRTSSPRRWPSTWRSARRTPRSCAARSSRPRAARGRPQTREMTRRKGVLDGMACRASWPTARRRTPRSARSTSSRVTPAGGSAKQGRDRKFRPSCRCADPQRREGALREAARQQRDPDADHGLGHRHRQGQRRRVQPRGQERSRRLQHRQAALPPHHHHDRRGRGRRAYPHPAADLLLPPDARAGRARPSTSRSRRSTRSSRARRSSASRTPPRSTPTCCASRSRTPACRPAAPTARCLAGDIAGRTGAQAPGRRACDRAPVQLPSTPRRCAPWPTAWC